MQGVERGLNAGGVLGGVILSDGPGDFWILQPSQQRGDRFAGFLGKGDEILAEGEEAGKSVLGERSHDWRRIRILIGSSIGK